MKIVVLRALSGGLLVSFLAFAPAFAETNAGDNANSGSYARAASTPSAQENSSTISDQDAGVPMFTYGGELDTHLQGEMIQVQKNNPRGSAYDDSDLSLYGNYSSWLSLNSDIKLERNRNDNLDDYYPDRNTFFRSEGLTLRQLYMTVRPVEELALYGGKIHPNFGSAYEQTPGIFYNFGTDYEQDERLGVGATYRLQDMSVFKNLRLGLETYYLDTSMLSTSLLSGPALDDPTANRVRLYTRGAFGPSNTGGLDSFTASVRGGHAERGLNYQVSFTREATDDPTGRTEYGESIGASYDPSGDGIPLGARWGVTPFLEYTHFNNFQGITNLNRHYVVGGMNFASGRWGVAVAGGLRQSEGISQDTDHQENVTVSYTVVEHLEVGFGVNHTGIANVGSWAAGPSLSYEIAF